MQRMLEMRWVYTLTEILRNCFVKNEGKLGILFLLLWFDKLMIWCQLIFIEIYYAITACTTYSFTFGKC